MSSSSLNLPGQKNKARGIPGRVFVLCFVPLLVILLVLTMAMGVRFQVIMNQVDKVRSLWPLASQELAARYDELNMLPDRELEELGVPRKKLLTLVSTFHSTTQFDSQSVAASNLESTIRETLGDIWQSKDLSNKLALARLLEADQKRKHVQHDWLGWVTIKGLRLNLPPIFEL